MKRTTKVIASILAVATLGTGVTACASDAEVASENVSKAADNFEVNRRITMFNGITDKYIMVITGACSIEVDTEESQLEVICKIGPHAYKKHFLGLSDNVSYSVEQGEPVNVSAYHYRIIFKPQSILPDPDFKASAEDGPVSQ